MIVLLLLESDISESLISIYTRTHDTGTRRAAQLPLAARQETRKEAAGIEPNWSRRWTNQTGDQERTAELREEIEQAAVGPGSQGADLLPQESDSYHAQNEERGSRCSPCDQRCAEEQRGNERTTLKRSEMGSQHSRQPRTLKARTGSTRTNRRRGRKRTQNRCSVVDSRARGEHRSAELTW